VVREAAPIPTIVTGRGRSRHSRPPTPLGTPGVRHPPRVLALDSSRYRNVPPTRIQQTPCSIAPARAAYNGPDAWGSNSSRKPTRDRWGASSGYEASGTHTDFDEIPIDQGGRSCRQAPGASSEKRRHVAHRRGRVRWGFASEGRRRGSPTGACLPWPNVTFERRWRRAWHDGSHRRGTRLHLRLRHVVESCPSIRACASTNARATSSSIQ
jgi:hypothetical protein